MQNIFKSACLVIVTSLVSFGSTLAQETSQSKFDVLAPESCWMYSSWRAAETYDPKSENASERLLAEPAVQQFKEDMIQRVGLLAPAMAETVESLEVENELVKRLRVIGLGLAKAALTRDGCFFVERLDFDVREGPQNIQGALVVDIGKDAKAVLEGLTKHFESKSPVEKTIGGIRFQEIALDENSKSNLFLGAANETLIVGLGESAVTGVLRRRSNKTRPAWLANIKVGNPADRVRGVNYVNVEAIREELVAGAGDQAKQMFDMLGLGNVTSIESTSGFTQSESFSRMLIRMNGSPEGLLDLAAGDGFAPADLQRFPKDSLFAVGVSVEPRQAFKFIRWMNLQMGGRNEYGQVVEQIKNRTGIDLQTELVNLLGSNWTLHNGIGYGWVSGLTAIAEVKDPEKLSATIQKLVKNVILETDGDTSAPVFSKRKVGDDEVYTVRFQGSMRQIPFPIEPSWAISGNKFVFGLYPETVKAAISDPPREMLIDHSEFDFLTRSFSEESGDGKLIGMAYVDAARNFEISYPNLKNSTMSYTKLVLDFGKGKILDKLRLAPGKQAAIAAILNGIELPPARSIHKHLEPSWVAIRKTKAGIEFDVRQTIPSLDAGFVAPVAVGLLLPAVQSVRGDARRVASQNNLRQITLAALNFESMYQNFPAGFSTNGEGEKLLSWRVYVLPFIEQNDLFKQFKLDEPWDSPNNKPLAAKMPGVFRSPVSNAKPGMTVYRGIGGEHGLLGPPRKPGISGSRFGSVTDGSSNTIFAMEVSDELAVPWTKPDEGIDSEEFDSKQFFGSHSTGTVVSMCDGSTHVLPESIENTTLKHLMQRADGNLVDVPGRRARSRRSSAQKAKIHANANQRYAATGEVILTADNMLSPEEKVKLAKRRHVATLRQVAIAMYNFESAHAKFPAAYSVGRDGKPLLSWRVQILPFIEEGNLFNQFKKDEPWDSDHNIKLLAKIPKSYQLSEGMAKLGKTTLMASGGTAGMIGPPNVRSGVATTIGIGFSRISDGTSNTLLLMEVPDELAVEWTKPTDFDPDLEAVKKMLSDELNIAMADGSSRRVPKGLSTETFQAIRTTAGGEVVRELDKELRGGK